MRPEFAWFEFEDGDLASNNGGWQWVAGSGIDAAPYYRSFNPVTQAERFDPEGDYIRPGLLPVPGSRRPPPLTDRRSSRTRRGSPWPL